MNIKSVRQTHPHNMVMSKSWSVDAEEALNIFGENNWFPDYPLWEGMGTLPSAQA